MLSCRSGICVRRSSARRRDTSESRTASDQSQRTKCQASSVLMSGIRNPRDSTFQPARPMISADESTAGRMRAKVEPSSNAIQGAAAKA